MRTLTARAGPVRLLFLIAALAIASPIASAQPDPAPSAVVETSFVNLSKVPAFQMTVTRQLVLHFAIAKFDGQTLLRVIAVAPLDSLDTRIRGATNWLTLKPGIFTPFEPANMTASLRNFRPERTLSYHRRLT